MTPEQRIKREILIKAAGFGSIEMPAEPITAENVDELFDSNNDDYQLQDATSEFRCSGVKTNITAPWSRHYESESRAALVDGVWIGWTYWFGGGKHGEPEAVEWMDEAYELTCVEEEKVVTVRTFSKIEEPQTQASE